MNSDQDGSKPSEQREAKPKREKPEPFEPEAKAAQEPADSRESSERGYGWGV
jgi:hypothetical protein